MCAGHRHGFQPGFGSFGQHALGGRAGLVRMGLEPIEALAAATTNGAAALGMKRGGRTWLLGKRRV